MSLPLPLHVPLPLLLLLLLLLLLPRRGARAPRGGVTRQGVVLTDFQSLLDCQLIYLPSIPKRAHCQPLPFSSSSFRPWILRRGSTGTGRQKSRTISWFAFLFLLQGITSPSFRRVLMKLPQRAFHEVSRAAQESLLTMASCDCISPSDRDD